MTSLDEFARKLKDIAYQSKLHEAAAVFKHSRSYIDSNREKLLKQYPNCWIAVHKEQVLAVDEDLRSLVGTIRKSGMPLEQVAVELLASEETPILL